MSRPTRWLALAAVAVVALGAASFAVAPRLRLAYLVWRLDRARDATQAAARVRDVLRLDTEAARDAVARYAARSPLRAYDRRHGSVLLVDGGNGEVHQIEMVQQGEIRTPPGLPEPDRRAMEEAVARAVTITAKKMTIGKPPILWSGVRRLPGPPPDSGGCDEGVTFVLRQRDRPRYFFLTCQLRDGRLAGRMTSELTDDALRHRMASD